MKNTVSNRIAKFAVIGDPVTHSLSPKMHNAAFKALGLNAIYEAVHVKPEALAKFADKARGLYDGVNVTVPHKGSVMNCLDKISPLARLAGSVNTITNKGGKLIGDSTDGKGLEAAIKDEFGIEVSGASFFFIGCGGASRAVAVYFASVGAKSLSFVNRTVPRGVELCRAISKEFPSVQLASSGFNDDNFIKKGIESATVIIQATSIGLKSDDPIPLPEKYFLSGKCYYDLIYGKTKFLQIAEKNGASSADGLSMLAYQGAESFKLWTGLDAPIKIMKEALKH